MDENRPDIVDEPRNPHVHHDPGDINAISLTKFGILMVFMIVIFLAGLWGLFDYFIKREMAQGALPSHAVHVTEKLPPEPRLQEKPSQDYRQMFAQEQQQGNQYGTTPDAGFVRIPINRAMELMAHKGFPVLPNARVPQGGAAVPLGFEAAGGSLERAQPGGPQPAATQPVRMP